MARFVVKTDGYGAPGVYDTRDARFVADSCVSEEEASALAAKLNARGSAPVRDAALPDQLSLDGLTDDLVE